MQKFTRCKIAQTPHFPARNACFSGAFLPFRLQDCVKYHHFALEIQDSERFSGGLTPGCISGQKTTFRTGNSSVKRIADIVKILGNKYPNYGTRSKRTFSGQYDGKILSVKNEAGYVAVLRRQIFGSLPPCQCRWMLRQ